MKLLFICSRDVHKKTHGGYQCTNRNYTSFYELLGKDNVDVLDLIHEGEKSIFWSFERRINRIFGFFDGLSSLKMKKIVNKSKNYDIVFIDTSTYGLIAYYLKKEKYEGKIICFFHNVEFNIQRQKVKQNPIKFLEIWCAKNNERKACQYSDKLVVLTERDKQELKRIYGACEIDIIPISLSDTLINKVYELTAVPPTLIFIGNRWYANIHGIKWFVRNVLDNVDIRLQIVGTEMDVLKKHFNHPKVEFLGFVPDLSSVLIHADYVISPIFIGGGMKVKTCEALMYGKHIIGTKEAFEGYDIDYMKVGALCERKEDFINIINNNCSIVKQKFNTYSRECFLEKYSFQATLQKFNDILTK